MYATGMYLYLSEIISGISVFNFGYLPSGHCNLREEGSEVPWLFCLAKRGSRAKKVWETLLCGVCVILITIQWMETVRYTTLFICEDYISSNGMNVVSCELCRKGRK